jgi:hypothetical protein
MPFPERWSVGPCPLTARVTEVENRGVWDPAAVNGFDEKRVGVSALPHRIDGRPDGTKGVGDTNIVIALDHHPSRTLLLPSVEERELLEVHGLSAGSAAAVPTAQQWLQELNRLRECQAGRGAFGQSRSSVRKACAQVTSAQW